MPAARLRSRAACTAGPPSQLAMMRPLAASASGAIASAIAGLGTIARVASEGKPIYARKLTFAEAEARLARYYRPYHTALNALCNEAVAKFGACLILE
mgnify:CR=1 FL=1